MLRAAEQLICSSRLDSPRFGALPVSVFRCCPLLLALSLAAGLCLAGEPDLRRRMRALPPVETDVVQCVACLPMEEVPSPVSESESPLTLADLQRLALAYHPALGRAEAQVDAACGRWVQVGLRKNPMLGYEGTDIGESGSAGKQGGFLRQEFVTGNKRQLAREVAQREMQQRQQDLEVVRQRVLGDVQAHYLEAAFAERRIELLSELAELAAREVELMQQLRTAQEVSTLDLLTVQRVHAEVTLQKRRGEHQLATARRKLAAVVGVTQLAPTRLAEPPRPETPLSDWKDLWDRLLAESPQLASALAARQRAEANLQLARAGRRPNVELLAGVQNDMLVQETLANVALGVPLPLFDRNQGAICEAEAELSAAENEIERVRMNLQHRLASSFGAWLDARRRAEYYAENILPNLRQSLKLVERAFQQKQLDYLTVVRTQKELIQTRLEQLEAEQQTHAALAELDNLLLADSLESSAP